jgi:ribosome maturation factor RimP
MQAETQIRSLEDRIQGLLADHPSHFLVEVRIKPTNNIKVFIDGDEGVNLGQLIEYNRKLYRQLEESGAYPDGNFSLEVSSPGLDEPLKMFRQYKKNIGRYVDVTMQDLTKSEGKLVDAIEDAITIEIETGKGKKKEVRQDVIPFDQIKQTKIQIKF